MCESDAELLLSLREKQLKKEIDIGKVNYQNLFLTYFCNHEITKNNFFFNLIIKVENRTFQQFQLFIV